MPWVKASLVCPNPNCSAACECFVREIQEGVSFYDEYTRHCKKCGHTTKKTIEKGSFLLAVHQTECPFCGLMSKNHPRAPKEASQSPATS